jgi:hypothetical protein
LAAAFGNKLAVVRFGSLVLFQTGPCVALSASFQREAYELQVRKEPMRGEAEEYVKERNSVTNTKRARPHGTTPLRLGLALRADSIHYPTCPALRHSPVRLPLLRGAMEAVGRSLRCIRDYIANRLGLVLGACCFSLLRIPRWSNHLGQDMFACHLQHLIAR